MLDLAWLAASGFHTTVTVNLNGKRTRYYLTFLDVRTSVPGLASCQQDCVPVWSLQWTRFTSFSSFWIVSAYSFWCRLRPQRQQRLVLLFHVMSSDTHWFSISCREKLCDNCGSTLSQESLLASLNSPLPLIYPLLCSIAFRQLSTPWVSSDSSICLHTDV